MRGARRRREVHADGGERQHTSVLLDHLEVVQCTSCASERVALGG